MGRANAKQYFEWFQEQIPIRITVVQEYIKSFPNYHDWEANLTPISLEVLGSWFIDRITTRLRSKDEIDSIYVNAPGWFKNLEVPEYDLSIMTESLCIDMGMYLSQVIVHKNEKLHWEMITRPKRHIDYHQPVLLGQGKVPCNPVRLVRVYAYKIANGNLQKEGLKELYEIWSKILYE